MEPVTYAPAYQPQAGPLARLAWSVEALEGLADAMQALAYAGFVRESYARLGLPVPMGLLP